MATLISELMAAMSSLRASTNGFRVAATRQRSALGFALRWRVAARVARPESSKGVRQVPSTPIEDSERAPPWVFETAGPDTFLSVPKQRPPLHHAIALEKFLDAL